MTTFGELADNLPSDEEDEDDEEYVPEEEDSSAGEVSSEEEEEVLEEGEKSKKPAKRKAAHKDSKKNVLVPRKRRRGCFAAKEEEAVRVVEEEEEAEEKTSGPVAEEDNARSDSLWENFLQKSSRPLKRENEATKTKVERLYDFAGETIRVTQEVEVKKNAAKSVSAELLAKAATTNDKPAVAATVPKPAPFLPSSSLATTSPGSPRMNGRSAEMGGGVSSILDKLKNKKKMSVLDKSRLDWDSFTAKEGIKEELQIHNRGKDGYLEKVAFLERADYRQFEQERDLRLGVKRSKR